MSYNQPAPLLSGVQTVKSIRDTGYKSTDYAIAELIDNAVDAKAKNISVVIVEEPAVGASRLTYRATEIAVIDDGCGMPPTLANLALSFGGSGQYDNRELIGRFGMGLPQASVSQCRRTELWSWQNSQIEAAHKTYLDLDEIEKEANGSLVVPWPTIQDEPGYIGVPDRLADIFHRSHEMKMLAGQPISSGTIVRWTSLDRLRWVKASSVLKHTEFLLGRIYRRFLIDGDLNINIFILRDEGSNGLIVSNEQKVRPNDPMFLTKPSLTLLEYWERESPFAESAASEDEYEKICEEPAFFERENLTRSYSIPKPNGGGEAEVVVKYSEAPPECRPGRYAGANTHLGQQAKENRGISIMRANRELILEQTMINEPVDRWWGVEMDFPPELDEIFGVTNNKQDAPYFTTALRYVIENELSKQEAEDEGLFGDGDPVGYLYRIAYDIRKTVGTIKSHAKKEKKTYSRNTKPSQSGLSRAVSYINKKRSEQNPTAGEKKRQEEGVGNEEAAEAIETELQKKHGVSKEHAGVVAQQYREGVIVHFLEAGQSQSPAFFWPDEVYDDEQIYINTDHPAYGKLINPLRISGDEIEALSEKRAKELLGAASDGLALLLQSFARLELEVSGDQNAANHYIGVREEWGRRLREIVSDPSLDEIFLETEDD